MILGLYNFVLYKRKKKKSLSQKDLRVIDFFVFIKGISRHVSLARKVPNLSWRNSTPLRKSCRMSRPERKTLVALSSNKKYFGNISYHFFIFIIKIY